tara:strand:+ start:2304 stop:2759 length:456 start_codon:yes stop_codon:yes gene_type:complete
MSVIQGEAFWAHVINPNTKWNPEGEWSIEIGNLDKINKSIAEADGLTIKNKNDERGDFVTLKQYARTKEGTARPMRVEDAKRNPFPADQLIGNGSKVNASYYPKPYTQYGGGVKGYLQGVQVINLIKYNNDDFQVVPEGYDSNTNNEVPFE